MNDDTKLKLRVVPGQFSVCRLAPQEPVPRWATAGEWFAITKTHDELTVVCATHSVPAGPRAENGWGLLMVVGPLDFSLTGVLAALSTPLANGGVSLFAVSTYDTDYILVKQSHMSTAQMLLIQAGHEVVA